MWATIGNIFKFYAVFALIGCALFGFQAIQLNQVGNQKQLVLPLAIAAVVSFGLCVLFWNVKGPLIRGNSIARIVFGGWILLGVIFSLGFNLIFVGIFYLFTSEPAAYDYYGMFGNRDKEPKSRFKAPANWHPTGHVGPSGATLYTDPGSPDSAGIFNSFTPVQVVDKQGGFAHVVAETGERGWIDLRVLTEGA
jgi:hypothetical protein